MPVGVSAYVPLATKTLTGTQASVTFSGISQAYKDLVLVVASTTASLEEIVMQINNDTATTNYYQVGLRGTGTAASAYSYTAANTYISFGVNSYSATTPVFNSQLNFLDYSAIDKHKSILIRNNDANNGVEVNVARWSNTAGISTIKVYGRFAVSFTTGSTFTLYGIASA